MFLSFKHWGRSSREDQIESATSCNDAKVVKLDSHPPDCLAAKLEDNSMKRRSALQV